jgi:hypothetical protein
MGTLGPSASACVPHPIQPTSSRCPTVRACSAATSGSSAPRSLPVPRDTDIKPGPRHPPDLASPQRRRGPRLGGIRRGLPRRHRWGSRRTRHRPPSRTVSGVALRTQRMGARGGRRRRVSAARRGAPRSGRAHRTDRTPRCPCRLPTRRPDLLAVAAEASTTAPVSPPPATAQQLAPLVAALPDEEKNAFLVRLALCREPQLHTELLHRLRDRLPTASGDDDGAQVNLPRPPDSIAARRGLRVPPAESRPASGEPVRGDRNAVRLSFRLVHARTGRSIPVMRDQGVSARRTCAYSRPEI